MSIIDCIIILLVIIGGVVGYYRGIVSQLASVAGIAGGVIVCLVAGSWAEDVAMKIVPEAQKLGSAQVMLPVLARIVLFLLIYLSVGLGVVLLHPVLDKSKFGESQRWLGAIAEVFQSLMLISLSLTLWLMAKPDASAFSTRHAVDNVPFEMVMDLVPIMLGADQQPSDTLILCAEQ